MRVREIPDFATELHGLRVSTYAARSAQLAACSPVEQSQH
jgi:hypothetical protein